MTTRRRGRERQPKLVRYVSPFGAPSWIPRAEALSRRERDDLRWLEYEGLGLLSDRQQQLGPPRIVVY